MSKIKTLNAKRCVAVFMAVLMMILSLSYTNNNQTDAANTTKRYYVYNSKTGVNKGFYDLEPLISSNNNPRYVIGNDERVIDWTKSGVVKIIDSDGAFGSGFVIAPHVIATAAHCLYNYESRKPKKISKILLFDSNGTQAMSATPSESHIPLEFINATASNSNIYTTESDYALITVKEDLSNYACFNLGVPLDSFASKQPVVTVTGFPSDKYNNGNNQHTMYSGNGIVTNMDDGLMYYNVDTYRGSSGGPTYITESFNGNTYYTVIAINIAGNSFYPQHNIGTCITTDLIHFYNQNEFINW